MLFVICLHPQVRVTLEAEAFPQLDDQLVATGGKRQKVTTYELILRKGEAAKTVLVEMAGDHTLRLSKPSDDAIDVSGIARLKVPIDI